LIRKEDQKSFFSIITTLLNNWCSSPATTQCDSSISHNPWFWTSCNKPI